MCTQSINFWQKCQEYTMGKKSLFNNTGAKTGYTLVKVRNWAFIIHNIWKSTQRLKLRTWTHKTPIRIYGEKFLDFGLGNDFINKIPRAWSTRAKISKWDYIILDFSGGTEGKESAGNAGDLSLISGSGRSPGEGNGKLLQYSCLENSMD